MKVDIALVLTAAEYAALAGLSSLAVHLYVVLRKHMDYETGLIGTPRGISLKMLAEETSWEVPKGRGHQIKTYTVNELRRGLDELARAGLLVRKRTELLIFEAKFALRKGASKTNPTLNPTQNPTRITGMEAASVLDSSGKPHTEPNAEPHTHQRKPVGNTKPPSSTYSGNGTDARAMVDGDGDCSDIPDPPAQAGQWLLVFNRRYGHAFDPASLPVRKRWFPIWSGWVDARVTLVRVDEAVRLARATAREPIVDLVAYVDRMLASQGSARSGSKASRRRDTVAGMTGSGGGGHEAIDATAARVG